MREAAKANSPPVLVLRQNAIDLVRSHLSALKQDVQGITNAAQVPPELAARFPGLTDAGVKALQATDAMSYESQIRSFLNRGLGNMPLVTKAGSESAGTESSRRK